MGFLLTLGNRKIRAFFPISATLLDTKSILTGLAILIIHIQLLYIYQEIMFVNYGKPFVAIFKTDFLSISIHKS